MAISNLREVTFIKLLKIENTCSVIFALYAQTDPLNTKNSHSSHGEHRHNCGKQHGHQILLLRKETLSKFYHVVISL